MLTLIFTAVCRFTATRLGFAVAFPRARSIGERLKTLASDDGARGGGGGGDGVHLPDSAGVLFGRRCGVVT